MAHVLGLADSDPDDECVDEPRKSVGYMRLDGRGRKAQPPRKHSMNLSGGRLCFPLSLFL